MVNGGKQVEVEDILCTEEGIHYGVFSQNYSSWICFHPLKCLANFCWRFFEKV